MTSPPQGLIDPKRHSKTLKIDAFGVGDIAPSDLPPCGRGIAYGANWQSFPEPPGLGVDPRLKAEDDETEVEDDEGGGRG